MIHNNLSFDVLYKPNFGETLMIFEGEIPMIFEGETPYED
jgi:hypothetical protein